MLINSRYRIMTIQPETISQNLFDYDKILKTNEIQLVNRRIGKKSVKEGQDIAINPHTKNSLLDLRMFFVMSSEEIKENQLNYFLIKKWVGLDATKANKRPTMIIYLSVDFFYSIYIEKTTRNGEVITELKTRFHAEKSTVHAKPLEKVIVINYIEKGLLWNSKKKPISNCLQIK